MREVTFFVQFDGCNWCKKVSISQIVSFVLIWQKKYRAISFPMKSFFTKFFYTRFNSLTPLGILFVSWWDLMLRLIIFYSTTLLYK